MSSAKPHRTPEVSSHLRDFRRQPPAKAAHPAPQTPRHARPLSRAPVVPLGSRMAQIGATPQRPVATVLVRLPVVPTLPFAVLNWPSD
jgi:hypothetical protein